MYWKSVPFAGPGHKRGNSRCGICMKKTHLVTAMKNLNVKLNLTELNRTDPAPKPVQSVGCNVRLIVCQIICCSPTLAECNKMQINKFNILD